MIPNLITHQTDINRIIEAIVDFADIETISIFGAGHWFIDEECPTSDVDLIVVVYQTDPSAEMEVNMLLSIRRLDHIGKYPVHVRFFWQDELEGKSVGNSEIASNIEIMRIYIRQFSFYKLLHGKPWPISSEILPPLSYREELNHWLWFLRHLPSYRFLHSNLPTNDVFDWPDFIKLYLFIRILKATLYDDYVYDISFERIRKRYIRNPADSIHTASEYRKKGYSVKHSMRLNFYKSVIQEMQHLYQ